MWGHRYWSYRETGMGGASHHPCGGLCVSMSKNMKNFIKQNWFKVGLLAVAIIVVFFYLLLWQPAQKRKEALANNIKCRQEGSELVERAKKELRKNQIYYTPQFRFNDELNTCLYSGSRIGADNSGSLLTSFIKDVYTNQDLASYTSFFTIKGEEESVSGDKGKYELLREKYFP